MPGVILLTENEPGSYHARNRGLSVARGDFCAFTDADCAPEPDWLETALAFLSSHPKVGICAGRINLFQADDRWFSPALIYERAFAFDQKRNAERGLCVTANWVSPRAAIDQAGGFDTSARSGGDFRLAQAIVSAGWQVAYLDASKVWHPARSSLRALCRKRRRVIGGAWCSAQPSSWRSGALTALFCKELARKSYRAAFGRGGAPLERSVLLGVIGVLLVVTMSEIARLSLGGEPLR